MFILFCWGWVLKEVSYSHYRTWGFMCEGETYVNLKDFNPELVRQGPGVMKWDYHYLAGGFKYFLFSSLPGEGFYFD